MASYQSGTVSVTTAATLICTVDKAGGVLIQNNGSGSLYVGGASVTSDTTATGGLKIAAGAIQLIPSSASSTGSALYGIVATSTANVAFVFPSEAN